MPNCPGAHDRHGKKKKGKAKSILADRRIDDKDYFLQGIQMSVRASITDYFKIDGDTTHICKGCLKKWQRWLGEESAEDHQVYSGVVATSNGGRKAESDNNGTGPHRKKQKHHDGATRTAATSLPPSASVNNGRITMCVVQYARDGYSYIDTHALHGRSMRR